MKRFEQEKKFYYCQKDKILKVKDLSGRVKMGSSPKDDVNERKKSNN